MSGNERKQKGLDVNQERYTCDIPALRRLRQEDLMFKGREILSQKKKKKRKKKGEKRTRD
jgi:hypothetical protein